MIVQGQPPRAASVDLDDPRFDPDVQRPDLLIFLDGVQQYNVTTYDMDDGFIVRVKVDAAGRFQLNEAGDEVATERVEGVVTAIFGVSMPGHRPRS
ncbi:hypothetical protein QCD71_12315 [Sphingomonas sp. PsM26]|nr:hypothetical protein [Sphingomonas sp. PsM26]